MWLGLGIAAALVAGFFWWGRAPLDSPDGVNSLETVTLQDGAKVWVSIRGTNRHRPVLLFLHGGPGSANLAKLRLQTPELEKHFVVVNFDQRGAGRSAVPGFDYSALNQEQMVDDAHQLVLQLKEYLGVEEVSLLGFSWGTVIGLELARRYPEDIGVYIGVGQAVCQAEGERLSLEYARQVARDTHNTRALADLGSIDPAYSGQGWYNQLALERQWLLSFGGVYRTANNFNHEVWMLLRAPEYSLYHFALWPDASSRSLKALWPEMMRVDFFRQAPEVSVPVRFFAGRYDYNTPSPLVERYYHQLRAPAGKRLVWFEQSAHDVFHDEPDRLVTEVLKAFEE